MTGAERIRSYGDRPAAFAAADDLAGEVVDGNCCVPGLGFSSAMSQATYNCALASLRDFGTPASHSSRGRQALALLDPLQQMEDKGPVLPCPPSRMWISSSIDP